MMFGFGFNKGTYLRLKSIFHKALRCEHYNRELKAPGKKSSSFRNTWVFRAYK